MCEANELQHTMANVLEFPDKLSFNKYVNFDSRKGAFLASPACSRSITLDNTLNDLLIFLVSSKSAPYIVNG
jgi:hypothetical protein